MRRHPANPRYLAGRDGRPVVLVGSHTWANFASDPGEAALDYPAYLDFLERQKPLVEQDDGVLLEPQDLLRLEHARGRRRSGAFVPGGEVLRLLRGQLVDGDSHRRELQPRDLLVDLGRDRIDLLLE